MSIALQDLCLPEGTCYGCGSANPEGVTKPDRAKSW